jgi:hypothetical protein
LAPQQLAEARGARALRRRALRLFPPRRDQAVVGVQLAEAADLLLAARQQEAPVVAARDDQALLAAQRQDVEHRQRAPRGARSHRSREQALAGHAQEHDAPDQGARHQ